MKQRRKQDILQLIPRKWLSANEKALARDVLDEHVAHYRIVREMSSLNEIDTWKYEDVSIAIWRENNTFILISHHYCKSRFPEKKRSVVFSCHVGEDQIKRCAIYGETDTTVAETATWFWSLQLPDTINASLQIDHCAGNYDRDLDHNFDFGALQPEQLSRVIESNPTRQLELVVGRWSPEQAVVMASRPYPLKLKLYMPAAGGRLGVKDDGTEFISALEKRQSSFGSLHIFSNPDHMPFSRANMERLLQLDWIFDELTIGAMDEECALLPFSAKVHALQCEINPEQVPPEDFDSLNIVTRDLNIALGGPAYSNQWTGSLASCLNRVAELGHFERLGLSMYFVQGMESVPVAAEALIRAINGNSKLTHLSLINFQFLFAWGSHIEEIFNAIAKHKTLQTVTLDPYPFVSDLGDGADYEDYEAACQPHYSALERLLCRNRNLAVLETTGERISNETSIDKIYALNHFYNGSKKLVQEFADVRRLLFMMALTKSTSSSFQDAGMLFADHTDLLCEFVAGMNLDAAVELGMNSSVASASDASLV